MGWKRALATIPYGKQFQKHRKLISQQINSRARLAFRGLELREARTLVRNIMANSEGKYNNHLTRLVVSCYTRLWTLTARSFSVAIITQI